MTEVQQAAGIATEWKRIVAQIPDTPQFHLTNLESPLFDISFAIGAVPPKSQISGGVFEYQLLGSGVIIGPHIGITALHVLDEYAKKFHGRSISEIGKIPQEERFGLIVHRGPAGGLETWYIEKYYYSADIDTVILQFYGATGGEKWAPFRPRLQLDPPRIGSRVHAIGHSALDRSVNGLSVSFNMKTWSATGEVQEIHPAGRDKILLRFPCFLTNARFDGGMSGGGVFTEDGNLCGIVCSNMAPTDGGQHTSYVSLLYPVLGLTVGFNRDGYPHDVMYPALELARGDFILAAGWERVALEVLDGDIRVVLHPE